MMLSLNRCKLIPLGPLVVALLFSQSAHAQDAVAPDFSKKANADYQFYATIGFLNKYLLGRK